MAVLLIVVIFVVLYGPFAWARSVLKRFDREEYFSGNGFDLAHLMIDRLQLSGVSVAETPIGDHYDPEKKIIGLTRKRCGRRTLTAVVVAAHEVGHAIQDHAQYGPLRTRTRLVGWAARIERIGAAVMMVVPVVALITRVPATGALIFLGGLGTLCIPLMIHLLTLPAEFDASFRRALPLLMEDRYIPPEDIPAARKILLACALTYVANALVGL
ncbi:MAG: zinc metallopeptidase, partial [Desulfobacterales bacterium]